MGNFHLTFSHYGIACFSRPGMTFSTFSPIVLYAASIFAANAVFELKVEDRIHRANPWRGGQEITNGARWSGGWILRSDHLSSVSNQEDEVALSLFHKLENSGALSLPQCRCAGIRGKLFLPNFHYERESAKPRMSKTQNFGGGYKDKKACSSAPGDMNFLSQKTHHLRCSLNRTHSAGWKSQVRNTELSSGKHRYYIRCNTNNVIQETRERGLHMVNLNVRHAKTGFSKKSMEIMVPTSTLRSAPTSNAISATPPPPLSCLGDSSEEAEVREKGRPDFLCNQTIRSSPRCRALEEAPFTSTCSKALRHYGGQTGRRRGEWSRRIRATVFLHAFFVPLDVHHAEYRNFLDVHHAEYVNFLDVHHAEYMNILDESELKFPEDEFDFDFDYESKGAKLLKMNLFVTLHGKMALIPSL
ncbi:unnamed protein product [Nesidiocoris tenuis]|uniref:Uncharacterized protein n=1 Tax=Nesidiocoris tenuis TaxID=355587 RepID=A0A6H5G0R8_9HEMI|nr:unnamed protein product [Nesidiocoris tenuis]